VELIHSVLGIDEEEPLPQDIVLDILNKYSFLDPTDTERWLRLSKIAAVNSKDDSDGDGGDGGDDMDFDLGGGDDMGGDMDLGEGGDDVGDEVSESNKAARKKRAKLLQERKAYLKEAKKKRLTEIRKRWKESRDDIFIRFCEQNHFSEWQNKNNASHCIFVNKIDPKNNPLFRETLEIFKDSKNDRKLQEKILTDIVNEPENIPTVENKIKEALEEFDDE